MSSLNYGTCERRLTMDNYDQYRWMDFEMYNPDETFEVCMECLRCRVGIELWLRPDEHILSFYISLKPIHILTLCVSCLEDQYGGRVKL